MSGNPDIRANLVGQGFQKTPMRANHVRMNVIGEIKQAINFDNDDLYIEWEFFLPPHWKPDYEDLYVHNPSEDVKRDWNVFSSITQSSSPVLMTNKEGENELVSNFCFPFDIQVQTPSETFNGMKKFPILFLTLGSLDSWGRKKLEGYSYVEVPHSAGYHEINVKAWAPSQSIRQRVHEFFLGGQTKLYDIKKIAENSTLSDENTHCAIDRHNLITESKGSVLLSFNVAFQSAAYKDESRSLQQARGANMILQKEKLLDPIQIQNEVDQLYQGGNPNNQYAPVIKNSNTTTLRYKDQQL